MSEEFLDQKTIDDVTEDEDVTGNNDVIDNDNDDKETATSAKAPDDVIDFDELGHFTENNIHGSSRRSGGSTVLSLSVVNTEANGKRVTLSKALHAALGLPKTIQATPTKDGTNLIIGETIPKTTKVYRFSSGKGTRIIYNSELVHNITNDFNLVFSPRTSLSFKDVKIIKQSHEEKELLLAKIRMTSTNETDSNNS